MFQPVAVCRSLSVKPQYHSVSAVPVYSCS